MSARTPAASPETLVLLPHPVASTVHAVGQLLTPSDRLDASSLADRHYDDTFGVPFYKDILKTTSSGALDSSLGGVSMFPMAEVKDVSLVRLAAEKMDVRALKSPAEALALVSKTPSAQAWLKLRLAEGRDVGFVTKVQSVRNANWRRCSVVDIGAGMGRVREERRASRADEEAVEFGSEGLTKVDSKTSVEEDDLPVASPTGSKSDVLAVEIRRVVLEEGDGGVVNVQLGDAVSQGQVGAYLK